MLAPTLFTHGTEEQRDRSCRKWQPANRSGRKPGRSRSPAATWPRCARRRRAPRVAGCSTARRSGAAARCSATAASGFSAPIPAAERHRGLTYLMFDLHASRGDGPPDRPTRRRQRVSGRSSSMTSSCPTMTSSAASSDGWRAAMSTASNERGMSLRSPARFVAPAQRLVRVWTGHAAWTRPTPTGLPTRGSRRRPTGCIPSAPSPGWPRAGNSGAESSVTKVFWSDLDVALHQTAWMLRGADGEVAGPWTEGLLFALGGPIYAGTNEMQRNIVAERLLGLPRETGAKSHEVRPRRPATRFRRQYRRRTGRRRRPGSGPGLGRPATQARPGRCGHGWRSGRDRVTGPRGVRRARTRPGGPGRRLRTAGPMVCSRAGHRIHSQWPRSCSAATTVAPRLWRPAS